MAKGVRMDLLHLRPVEGLGNTIEGVPGRARLAYPFQPRPNDFYDLHPILRGPYQNNATNILKNGLL
jgi:hypothetical protein